jgi:fumarate reductase flavoprotein subunit
MMENMYTDVVVVGGGASGIAAALAAAEKGLKVILLEKGVKVGGAGLFGAMGFLAYESKHQKASGETATIEEGYKELMNYTHYKSNPALTRAIFERSSDTIDWLEKYGLETKLVENTQVSHQGKPRTYHQYVDKFAGFKKMFENLEAMGGTVLRTTAGKELVRDDHGKIVGVKAEKQDGSWITISAKAVILATGGYVGNKEMLGKYMDIDVDEVHSMGERKCTGDGINMAFAAGADEYGIRTFEMHCASVVAKLTGSTIFTLTNLPLLWVNKAGKRFTDENVVYDFTLWANAVYAAGGYYYYLFDEKTLQEFKHHGTELTDSFERLIKDGHLTPILTIARRERQEAEVTGNVPPLEDIEQAVQEAIDANVAWKGTTLEHLANQINVNPETLKATVEKYNQAVENGKDPEFFKPKEVLKYKVSEGPFYAVKAQSTILGTIGGVRVNEKLEAVDKDLKPIPGLYVVGNDAGGLYGDSYPVFEGLSLSFAFNSGRISGYSAAEYVNPT